MRTDESLRQVLRRWKRWLAGPIKGILRRLRDQHLPNREIRAYQSWIRKRQAFRKRTYTQVSHPGLFSIVTAVWDGSPVHYLRELAASIREQNSGGDCEWVLLDNGCSNPELVQYLAELSSIPWVSLHRSSVNLGIVRGLRTCLEVARGRYVLPVDGDDLLYSDALRVVGSAIVAGGYPPLLYTDEDKVIGKRHYQPYFKPDWDPVLLLNSAYTAHLGVIDRQRALELGAYGDEGTEGSPDWDVFVRFLTAGHCAVHIPEIVYSWRVHASSTADDAASKPYIVSSQRKVLQRFLEAQPKQASFVVESSSLFAGEGHWHFQHRTEARGNFVTLSAAFGSDPRELLDIAHSAAALDGFVCFVGRGDVVESPEWETEVLGIMELHPDTVMVGARVQDRQGTIVEAGLEFGFAGLCGSPYRGYAADDPGYFGQLWKQRSVDAVSTHFAVARADFLISLLENLPSGTSVAFLGVWAGLYAAQTGRRVVYSPFLSAVSDVDLDRLVGAEEKRLFREIAGGEPTSRYRSQFLSHTVPFGLGDPATIVPASRIWKPSTIRQS